MPCSPPLSATFRRLCLPAILGLLGILGCVKRDSDGALYVYDNTSSSVQAWSKVSTVQTAAEAGEAVAAPDRTILSALFAGTTLAWGGLALDSSRNLLYLVSEGGIVYVIANASTQDGTLSATSDITSFYLGEATDRYSVGSVFGQASVDPGSNLLYVLETSKDGSGSRIWKIASPNEQTNSTTLTPAASYTIGISNDTYGSGVAAVPGGGVYGLFGGGGPAYSSSETWTGPRLRLGPSGSFVPANALGYSSYLLIGGETLLADPLTFGALGYDAQNGMVYVFSGPATATTAVHAFRSGDFSSGFDIAPDLTLGDAASSLASLRIIAHPLYSDWLLGAGYAPVTGTTGTGAATLFIWKAPSEGGSAVQAALPETASGALEIRGMAIADGD